MPNHVHATIAFRKTNKSINKIIGDGKRFIGYEIINRLRENCFTDVLQELENAVTSTDKKRGKLHEVWEDSFDWKECVSDAFTLQKSDYMHMNPCIGKWLLAKNPFEYEYSSARFYICVSGNFTDRPFQLKIKKKYADNYFDNHIYFFTNQYFWADKRSET